MKLEISNRAVRILINSKEEKVKIIIEGIDECWQGYIKRNSNKHDIVWNTNQDFKRQYASELFIEPF
jgi:hypothetical protein